jgi:hypothetical protein
MKVEGVIDGAHSCNLMARRLGPLRLLLDDA